MKKAIAWLLVIAMTAALSIGATLAYLTDTDEDVNVMTVGQVKIDQLEYERTDVEDKDADAELQEFHNNKPLYPAVNGGDWSTDDAYVDFNQIGKDDQDGIWNPADINNEVDKMVFVKNKGDWDAYVRTVFAFEAGNYTTLEEFQSKVHLNVNDTDWTWEWTEPPVKIGEGTYFVATATYNKVLEPGALTEISLSQIALDPSATNEDVAGFGDTYQVLVQSQAVQTAGFEDADSALTAAFGELITDKVGDSQPPFELLPEDVPFENDFPTEGVDLRTALHYLDGDPNDTKITANVQTITFGLTKDYEDKITGLDGTLIDIDQDVDVYAYYKPNGSNYDLYILANDDIYTPKDSTSLCQEMTALTSVNTENLNTGRTENFDDFFRKCSALQTIDCSEWDMNNATSAQRMFRQCSGLKSADCSGWNAPNLTSALQMFAQNDVMASVDLTGWNSPALTDTSYMFYNDYALTEVIGLVDMDVANVTTMYQMFRRCHKLPSVNVTGWDTAKVTDMAYMFHECKVLEKINGIENLNVSNVTTMQGTFWNCNALQSMDLTKWNPSKVTDMYYMFGHCYAMKELKAGTWKLDSVTNTYSMFTNCSALESVDATNWGMPLNKEMGFMFAYCSNLEDVSSEGWVLGNVNNIHCMFLNCFELKSVDTGNWNTGSVTDMQSAFRACLALETLDVANWDVSNVVHMNSLFSGYGSNAMDMSLKEIDVSKWNPVSAQYMNHMFYGCAQLTSIDMSGWNLPNLYTTSHMFADCINLETIDVSGWQNTSNWYSMDAMFNDCRKVKSLDVSSFNTSNVVEFSQIFEACWSLEKINGLENWNTANGKSFDETFLNCSSLKELNLSSFDTRNAQYGNKHLNGDISQGFEQTFSGCNSLQKLILGANFDFDGNGTVTFVCTLPNPGAIDGQATVWYNEANGVYYAANEIPTQTAATYVAAIPPATDN